MQITKAQRDELAKQLDLLKAIEFSCTDKALRQVVETVVMTLIAIYEVDEWQRNYRNPSPYDLSARPKTQRRDL